MIKCFIVWGLMGDLFNSWTLSPNLASVNRRYLNLHEIAVCLITITFNLRVIFYEAVRNSWV